MSSGEEEEEKLHLPLKLDRKSSLARYPRKKRCQNSVYVLAVDLRPQTTAHSIALLKTPLSPPRTPNALPQLYLLVSVLVSYSSSSLSLFCLCSCCRSATSAHSMALFELHCNRNGLQTHCHSSLSLFFCLCLRLPLCSCLCSCSWSIYDHSALNRTLLRRQCPAQRTPNRTAKTHTESVLKTTSKEGNSSATETENHRNKSKERKSTHTSERGREKAERRRRRGER